jgi:5-methylcytosine-specific restriction endonuclease McrA
MVNRNRQKREIRKKVWDKSDKKCFYCRVEMVFKGKQNGKFMTMEHLIPKSQGGRLTEDNIVAACRACNKARGDKSIYEFVNENKKDHSMASDNDKQMLEKLINKEGEDR